VGEVIGGNGGWIGTGGVREHFESFLWLSLSMSHSVSLSPCSREHILVRERERERERKKFIDNQIDD
jgi:hypothetical protein